MRNEVWRRSLQDGDKFVGRMSSLMNFVDFDICVRYHELAGSVWARPLSFDSKMDIIRAAARLLLDRCQVEKSANLVKIYVHDKYYRRVVDHASEVLFLRQIGVDIKRFVFEATEKGLLTRGGIPCWTHLPIYGSWRARSGSL